MHSRATLCAAVLFACVHASVDAQSPPQASAAPPLLTFSEARDVLFPVTANAPSNCAGMASQDASIDCLVTTLYADDADALRTAMSLRHDLHVLAGVESAHTMNGGFRGMIQIVGERPVGEHRHHLEWVAAALRDFDSFFRALTAHSPHPTAYHPLPNAMRFLRSVNRTTPSAYARDWQVSYNVSGSLLRNADGVRETLFHEIFHLNDEVHTSGTRRRWSERILSRISARIIARCGTNRRCLAPYAPSTTTVRGGTYYAFQQHNGDSVVEYAAELALRYYQEQRAALRHERFPRAPFKCGPAENAEAWRLLSEEFFGGADLVPAC